MNWIELIAAALGIISVWYARKENILVFPFGIANVLIYIYICIAARLYANAGINAVYFVSNVYGWYMWSRVDENAQSLRITQNTRVQNLMSWSAVAIIYVGALLLLRFANRTDVAYLQSYVPYVDAFNTAFFLVATVLMAFKKVENWQFWIIGNIVSIPIYASQALYFTSIQYSVFLVLAILGYREWKRKIN
ncbi:MAG: nicotinamide riboside transporter PnuC [Petrimonas sp.]|nr:nicotinamide riboside transporter PnuC [Petrimonas sp.]